MRFQKIYLEITNICNLQCSFCPSTQRKARFMTPAQFETVTEQLRGYSRYLYFHLMGEPLLHPELDRLLDIAGKKGFYVNFTTNGTLLSERGAIIANSPTVHRINISLQSFEGNQTDADIFDYVNHCARFAKEAAAAGKIVSLRLWNGGGAEKRNGDILQALQRVFPAPWQIAQKNTVLDARVFLEFGEKFDWPSPDAAERGVRFCYALRDQIGVLSDGTVVPCCLDAEGRLALGNLFDESLAEILDSQRARAIYEGFSSRKAVEELCRTCGFASRF